MQEIIMEEGDVLVIDDNIQIVIYNKTQNQVALGIKAPKDMPIIKKELVSTDDQVNSERISI